MEITREQLVKAFHSWNKEIVKKPKDFAKKIEDNKDFAERQADELIAHLPEK